MEAGLACPGHRLSPEAVRRRARASLGESRRSGSQDHHVDTSITAGSPQAQSGIVEGGGHRSARIRAISAC